MKKEMELKSLDIFCEIIDNFGDIGVVYRLGKEFKKVFGENVKVRVILNRLDEFININSNVKNIQNQEIDGIQYVTYEYVKKNMCTFSTANVIIEAFGCTIPEEYMNEAYDNSDLLINLEYLSAEDWIESCHLQESPSGKGKLKKIFFMPGFTEKSGGVIADSLYLDRIKNVIENKEYYRKKYFSEIENIDKKIIGTVFSYEKNFTPLFRDLKSLDKEIVILAMGEKTQEGFKNFFEKNFIEKLGNIYKYGKIEVQFCKFLSQEDYEELINLTDFNFVRGEDSFIRAVLTGKPYLWHIYCQEDYAHMDKIEGFLDKYERQMKGKTSEEYMSEYKKLFKDYNFRRENSLEEGKEEYLFFFNNLKEIERCNSLFRDFLISNCNLINKIKDFIEKF
ncbi:putative repeat protein (TIGR03837 family) [Fusobacterium sp. PH5-7]|nr:elongation factor P maturation arginine rhamnosyltransferase EarP [Fusobacterium sp. PH5-7]MDH6457013.1 putative repeat protein (TIGR03837 family) [Fusobacterium sp. PH5-7]